jgi:intracellular septation protein
MVYPDFKTNNNRHCNWRYMAQSYSLFRLIVNWFIELLPIVAFWAGFQYKGMLTGIAWSLIATVLAVLLGRIIQHRWALFPLFMTGSFLIFGSYSLHTQSPAAFIIQHTLYYGTGGILLVAGLIKQKSLLKPLFDNLFALTDHGWRILARRWAVLFFILAAGNEVVWRTLPVSDWALYKISMTVSITVFGLWQLRLARRERLPDANEWGLKIG